MFSICNFNMQPRERVKPMELWDVYDKDRNRTGKTKVRGQAFEEGEYHQVVHICIFNSREELLIQQRQPFKEGWSNMWDVTVGGSSLTGESSGQAAERELFEEIGYKASLSETRPFVTVNFSYGFDDFYLLEDDEIDIESLELQYEEVQGVKWASKAEIMEMIECGDFIPYYQSLIDLLFDIRGSYGSHFK